MVFNYPQSPERWVFDMVVDVQPHTLVGHLITKTRIYSMI